MNHGWKALPASPTICAWGAPFSGIRSMRVSIEKTSSPELPVCSGSPQGTVLGPLLIPFCISYLFASITLRIYLSVDTAWWIWPSKGITTISEDLGPTKISTHSWCIQLDMDKCQHIHLGLGVARDLNMPNNTVMLSPLPHVKRISDLGAVIES